MTADNTRPADGEFVMVPREATREIISAMLESRASDEEGEFPALMDLIDFSGQNKNHAVVRAAYRAMLSAAPQQGGQEEFANCCDTPAYCSSVRRCTRLDEAKPQQPAEAVAYLDIGAGGYMDVGTELSDDELANLPKGRHVLGIIGTFGVDGYVARKGAPPSAIDIGKLRELAKWMRARADGGWSGKHQPVSAPTLRNWADTIDAALIGDGGEKGNG